MTNVRFRISPLKRLLRHYFWFSVQGWYVGITLLINCFILAFKRFEGYSGVVFRVSYVIGFVVIRFIIVLYSYLFLTCDMFLCYGCCCCFLWGCE